jgi:hypothetical protein
MVSECNHTMHSKHSLKFVVTKAAGGSDAVGGRFNSLVDLHA